MSREKAIEIGKEKVMKAGFKVESILYDTIFEILGYTEADYYGEDEISNIKNMFDTQNDIYEMKFYQYEDQELVECSFGKAISTSEYKNYDIFIFSCIEDKKRKYYVAKIINNK